MATPAMTDNSPAVGSISWAEFHIQYEGVEYTVPAGSTDQRWVWWRLIAGVGTLEYGAEIPQDLTDDDVVLFGNKAGTAVRIQSTTLIEGELIVDGTVAAKKVAADVMVTNELFSREGYFGTIAAEAIAAGDIMAAIGILGSLAVGNITISPSRGIVGDANYSPGGILIPQNTGGSILLPADGSPARFVGSVETKDLTVDGGLALNGLANYINGRLVLGSGTPDPESPTDIGYSMFNKSLGKLNTTSYVSWSRGLAKTTSGHYATIIPLSTGSRKELRIFDPVTKNVVATVHSDDAVMDFKGVTAIGNTFYVVGERWNTTAQESQWRIHAYTTAGVQDDGMYIKNSVGDPILSAAYYGMAIAADPDGSNLWVARIQGNGKVAFYCYNKNLDQDFPNDVFVTEDSGIQFLSGAFYVGHGDFGGSLVSDFRWILGGQFGSVFQQAVFDWNGVKKPTDTFGSQYVDGLIWDGTQWVTLDWDSSGAYLSTLSANKTDVTVYAQHDWTNAAGTKRSKPSTVISRVIPKRTWPTLSVPAPPKTGSGADVADRVNVYLDTDAVPRLLTTVTTGLQATVIAAALAGTGIEPKLATDPTDFELGDSTGTIESPLGNILLQGDGSWKLGELLGTPDGRFTFPETVILNAAAPFAGTVELTRIGNLVFAEIVVSRASSFTNAYTQVASAPVGYRPIGSSVVGPGSIFITSSGKYQWRIGTGGSIEVKQTAADTTDMNANIVYKVTA